MPAIFYGVLQSISVSYWSQPWLQGRCLWQQKTMLLHSHSSQSQRCSSRQWFRWAWARQKRRRLWSFKLWQSWHSCCYSIPFLCKAGIGSRLPFNPQNSSHYLPPKMKKNPTIAWLLLTTVLTLMCQYHVIRKKRIDCAQETSFVSQLIPSLSFTHSLSLSRSLARSVATFSLSRVHLPLLRERPSQPLTIHPSWNTVSHVRLRQECVSLTFFSKANPERVPELKQWSDEGCLEMRLGFACNPLSDLFHIQESRNSKRLLSHPSPWINPLRHQSSVLSTC